MRNEISDKLSIEIASLIAECGLPAVLKALDAFDIPNDKTFHFIHKETIVTAYGANGTWYCKY